MSLSAAPVTGNAFGLSMRIVSTDVWLTPTMAGANDLLTVGAEKVVRLSDAVLPTVAPAVTAPVVLSRTPAVGVVTATTIVQLLLAAMVPPPAPTLLPRRTPVLPDGGAVTLAWL